MPFSIIGLPLQTVDFDLKAFIYLKLVAKKYELECMPPARTFYSYVRADKTLSLMLLALVPEGRILLLNV
jgi:hypothetical protein